MESHDHPHLWDTRRDDDLFVILLWSPSGASLEPSNQAHIFRHLVVIMFLLWGTSFWSVGPIQLWTWMTRIAHSMMDDLISSGFPYYHTFDAILGHTFVLVKICRSSLICMIVLSHEIHVGPMVCFHFVLILQWSLSQVIKLGSYFLILSWFLDGVISGA